MATVSDLISDLVRFPPDTQIVLASNWGNPFVSDEYLDIIEGGPGVLAIHGGEMNHPDAAKNACKVVDPEPKTPVIAPYNGAVDRSACMRYAVAALHKATEVNEIPTSFGRDTAGAGVFVDIAATFIRLAELDY